MMRFEILMGIGLMLVGALAYALPEVQELTALTPAIAGIILATSGLVGLADSSAKRYTVVVNSLAGFFLLIYSSFQVIPDLLRLKGNNVHFWADIEMLGLSMVYLYLAITGHLKAKKKAKSAECPKVWEIAKASSSNKTSK